MCTETMESQVSTYERRLIHEYWSKSGSQESRAIIRDYARLMHQSEGPAEDALDLWVHLYKSTVQPLVFEPRHTRISRRVTSATHPARATSSPQRVHRKGRIDGRQARKARP